MEKDTYIGDLVYGANDGLVTTFAVVAASTGAGFSSDVIIILGLANLLADGFSMGASNFLARRSEQELRASMRKEKQQHRPPNEVKGPFLHGSATFLAFVIAGFVPIISYLFPGGDPSQQFLISSISAGLTFFGVGAARTFVTKGNAWQGGCEMLFVGGFAASVAYGIGWWVRRMFGVAL